MLGKKTNILLLLYIEIFAIKLDEEEELSDDENETTGDEAGESTLTKLVHWFLGLFGLCQAKK